MPKYRITFKDDGESIEGFEFHPNSTRAHRSAIRSAVAILMDTEPLDGVQHASVELREERTRVIRDVEVSIIVKSTTRREADGGPA